MLESWQDAFLEPTLPSSVVSPSEYGLEAPDVQVAYKNGVAAGLDASQLLIMEASPEASLAGYLIENAARLNRTQLELIQEREEAKRDPLTGLYQRPVLDSLFTDLANTEHLRRGDQAENSLIFIDIDHFKEVNDSYGHLTGDGVLRIVSRMIAARIRTADIAVRYGGEEIAVILQNCKEADAAEWADTVRKEVERDTLVTISCGVSELDLKRSLDDNLELADKAMYEAKRAGRNQVVTHTQLLDSRT